MPKLPDHIRCVYQLTVPQTAEADQLAAAIAIEQTVEVPASLITPDIEAKYVGKIESVTQHDDDMFHATIDYPDFLAAYHLPQLLNLLFGNTSIDHRVRLVKCVLTESILRSFHGPNWGIDRWRAHLNVRDRPLVCTAIKPRGETVTHFENLVRDFALGGGDMIKDDHNLVDASFNVFEERIKRCQHAVLNANVQTGHTCVYLPYVCAPVDELERYLECVLAHDVQGILIAPMLYGYDQIRAIASQTDLFIMSHPSVTGAMYAHPSHGIDAGICMGTLMRLAGVDASVFTNFGGRFNIPQAECKRIAANLRAPMGTLSSTWPTPAGGMQLHQLRDLTEMYGDDTILLIGGALLEHRKSLKDATCELMHQLKPA